MRQNTFQNCMRTNKDKAAAVQAAHPLVTLCTGVLPVWARHLATSRAQSETAVSEMMDAFASISPHLQAAQRQSQEITAALGHGDGSLTGLAKACESALAPLRGDAALPVGGAAAIDTALMLVRDAVNTIEQINRPFSQETFAVAAQVERMYIGFQYQDRISQMIALLETDIARLQQSLELGGPDTPELQDWLTRLEGQYAMAEQRNSHAGGLDSGSAADNETTFF
jgi:methyl-accepting chemotaxis protein